MEDYLGNKLFRKGNLLYLKLASETRNRKLGVIEEQSKNFITNRIYEKHLYRNGQAFGFNVELLRTATLFNGVKLMTDRDETFIIPVKFILEHGEYFHFKKQGFEKQIFIKTEQLKQFECINQI